MFDLNRANPAFWTRHFLSNPFRSIQDAAHWSLLSLQGWRLPIEISAPNNPGTHARTNFLHVNKWHSVSTHIRQIVHVSKYSDLLPVSKCLPGHSVVSNISPDDTTTYLAMPSYHAIMAMPSYHAQILDNMEVSLPQWQCHSFMAMPVFYSNKFQEGDCIRKLY